MNYSVQNLTQMADCDLLLTWAENEKADLVFKKTAEERVTIKFASTSLELDAILQGVVADLAAENNIIATLPDGPVKDAHVVRWKKLDYKKFLLETRRESYGLIALLERETDVARIEREIVEMDVFITAVKDRKEALAA